MSFFSLANGKKVDLSNIYEGIKINDNDEFLKKYDKNHDSIFDADELHRFEEDLKPYLEDKKLDKEEYISWYAKVMGMSVDAVKQLFSSGKDEEEVIERLNLSFERLEEAQAHVECINMLRNLANSAATDMIAYNGGKITGLYDKLRNLIDAKTAPNKIYQLIFNDAFTADLLERAEAGTLTKADYVETKIEQLKALYMIELMQDNFELSCGGYVQPGGDKAEIEMAVTRYINWCLDSSVKKAAQSADKDENFDFDKLIANLDKDINTILSMDVATRKKYFANINEVVSEKDAGAQKKSVVAKKMGLSETSYIYGSNIKKSNKNDKLSFDDVFELERKQKFNLSDFQAYKQAESNMRLACNLHNRLSFVESNVDSLKRVTTMHMGKKEYWTCNFEKLFDEKLAGTIKMFTNYYMGDAEQAVKDLNSLGIQGMKIEATPYGRLIIGFDKKFCTAEAKDEVLDKLLNKFKTVVNERYDAIIGDKQLEEYINEYNSARDKAIYGSDLEGLVSEYTKQNDALIDNVTGYFRKKGMILSVGGGILSVTPAAATGAPEVMITAGNYMIMGSMALEYGAKYTEASTRNHIDDEEISNLNKHLKMDAAGFIIGYKAGKMGNKAFGKILDPKLTETLGKSVTASTRNQAFREVISDPKMLNNFLKASGAKISTDFLISYTGDLVMTGALNIEDEDALSLLKSNLLGVVVGTTSDLADLGNIKPQSTNSGKTKEKSKDTFETTRQSAQQSIELTQKPGNTSDTRPNENNDKHKESMVENHSAKPSKVSEKLLNFEEKINLLKGKNGSEIFTNETIERIKRDFSDTDIDKLSDIIDSVSEHYKQMGYSAHENNSKVAATLNYIIDSVDPKNWSTVEEMYNFKSTVEQITEGESGVDLVESLNNEQLQMVKIIMDASKENGREYLKNIDDIIEYTTVMSNKGFTVDDVNDIFHMRKENGEYVFGYSLVKDGPDYNLWYNLDNLNIALKPSRIESCKLKINDTYPDMSTKELNNILSKLKYIRDAQSLEYLLNLKGTDGKPILNKESLSLISNYSDTYKLYDKLQMHNHDSRLSKKTDTYPEKNIPDVLVMVNRISQSFGKNGKNLGQNAYDMVSEAIDKGASSGLIKILDNLAYNKPDIDLFQAYINLGTIKDNLGCSKFSETALQAITDALGGYDKVTTKQIQFLSELIEKNPNITTKQILDGIKGQKNVKTAVKYENPFKAGGKFESHFEYICNTKTWNKLPQKYRSKLVNYFTKLVNQDENRFVRLVESGYFELCDQGKLNINDLLEITDKNKFFSKNYLNDVKKLYTGEPLVKEYPPGTKLSEVSKSIDEGEVASVDGKIYVNDCGQMVELKLTKEAFEKLFPLESRFNTRQQDLGDCWFVSSLDNLMDMTSGRGRAKIYQLFEQNGSEITVNISHTEYVDKSISAEDNILEIIETPVTDNSVPVMDDVCEIAEITEIMEISLTPETDKYKLTWDLNDELTYKHNSHIKGCLGLQLIELTYAFAKAEGPQKEISKDGVLDILSDKTKMDAIIGGKSFWFLNDIFGYIQEDGDHGMVTYDSKSNQHTVGQRFVFDKKSNIDDLIDALTMHANDENILCHFETPSLPKDQNTLREKILSYEYDIYSNHAYEIKGYDAEKGLVYYKNPWKGNSIAEMDIYNFIEYVNEINYVRLN